MEEQRLKKLKIIFFGIAGLLICILLINVAMLVFWQKSGYLGRFEGCTAGRIVKIEGDTLILRKENQNRAIKLGNSTEIKIGRAKGDAQNLEIGKYVFVAGNLGSDETMQAGVIRVFSGNLSAFFAQKIKPFLELFSK
ncbi:MAG: hypothetical protein PHQ47_01420 [Candidatus Portnoybacteria bacterium]|nr:hypothetical protein [Candidatus Portnoybacteria bacterium]